ncbi:MAG: DUF7033 domain-containing protein [Chitinophagaceae bacterium]
MIYLFTNNNSPRLEYIVKTIFTEWYKQPFRIGNSHHDYINHNGPRINYSNDIIAENELKITPSGFLNQVAPPERNVQVQGTGADAILFPGPENDSFGFDVFAAIFWLIARCEEYTPYVPDQFGRFEAEKSQAWQHNFLHIPLVQLWIEKLLGEIEKKFPGFSWEKPSVTALTTIDIDQTYAFLHRGTFQQILTFGKNFFKLNFSGIQQQIIALYKRQDPFDSYAYLHLKEVEYDTEFLYFFLMAEQKTRYDNNLPPTNSFQQKLMSKAEFQNKSGMHPSFFAALDEHKLKNERNLFRKQVKAGTLKARQHYIRIQLPATYKNYLAAGIAEDYSMGYATAPGFRAATALPFFWFDLHTNQPTNLKVFPFSFMDGAFHKQYPEDTTPVVPAIKTLWRTVQQHGGYFIHIWHNNTVTDYGKWKGWNAIFEQSLQLIHKGEQ